MRKESSVVMIVTLFLGLLTIQPINPSIAFTLPKIFVDPPETKDPLIGVGDTFTIKVNVSDVVDLYGWEVNMTFNPSYVNVTQVTRGPFLRTSGYSTLWTYSPSKNLNNTAGWVNFAEMIMPPYYNKPHGATGSGELASVTFQVKAVGGTLLKFAKTILNTVISENKVPIEHTREDGIFDNRPEGTNVSPVASFSVDPSVANVSDRIDFDASASYDPDGWLVSYHWDYGDGITEIYMREPLRDVNLTAETTHIYNSAGAYTVTLTVTDNDDATDTETASVTIEGHDIAVTKVKSSHVAVMPGVPVTINVTVANKGYPYTETFNVTAYRNETIVGMQKISNMLPQTKTTLIFTWDTTGASLNETYTLKANTTIIEGDYNITNNEYIDGIITIAETNILPPEEVTIGGRTFYVIIETTSLNISDFDFSQVDKKIRFTVTGKNGTGGFCNVTIPIDLLGGPYNVTFDGLPISPQPQETTNGTHTFLYFTYIHSSPTYIYSSHTIEITGETVATPPIAFFTSSTKRTIAGNPITFNATDSYDPDGNYPLTYSWNFGDGTSLVTDMIVDHIYTAAGNYTVTLTVKDSKQLTNSTQDTVTIINYPEAKFTYSPHFPLVEEPVTFDASPSKPKGGKIINYMWNFDDGATAINSRATHAFTAAGNYKVVLNITDSEGLWDTETQTVKVSIHNITVTGITATPNTVKIGQQITINITVANKGNFTETFNVTAYYDDTPIEERLITDLPSEDFEIVTIAWNTTGVTSGTYTLKAIIDDNIFIGDTVTIQKLDSQLSISVSPSTATVGSTVTINGTIIPTRQSVNITILYRLVGEQTWDTLATATTNEQGEYTYNWNPEKDGTYEVKASWSGDATTLPSESSTQTVTVQQATPIFLYIATASIIVAAIATTFYFLKIRKPNGDK